jgi:hypothetical protein
MELPDYYETMRLLKAKETLKQTGDHEWECWLRSGGSDMCTHLYRQSHGDLSIRKGGGTDGLYYLHLTIFTIDDCSAGMIGPSEPIEKLEARLARLLEWVRLWDGQVPTREDFETTAQQCGMGLDYN